MIIKNNDIFIKYLDYNSKPDKKLFCEHNIFNKKLKEKINIIPYITPIYAERFDNIFLLNKKIYKKYEKIFNLTNNNKYDLRSFTKMKIFLLLFVSIIFYFFIFNNKIYKS